MKQNGRWAVTKLIIHHELLLAYRNYFAWLNPLWLFVLVVILFPLAIGPESQQLQNIAPGIIWVAALLATVLSLDHLFQQDFQDGTLEQWVLSQHPLYVLVLAKVAAHWFLTTLPLLLITPLLGLFLHLSLHAIYMLWLTLLIGTPILNFLGAIGAALTVSLKNSGILLSLLILPFYIPILIFGAGAASLADSGISINGQLAFLGSLLILSLCLTPGAIAAALRIGMRSY